MLKLLEKRLLASDLASCLNVLQHLPELDVGHVIEATVSVPLSPDALSDMLANIDTSSSYVVS